MGLNLLGSSGKCTEAPNPNPDLFRIVKTSQYGDYVITKIHYPGCTTFKGMKILVVKTSIKELKSRIRIDPHFLEDENLIARFPATNIGWKDASLFVQSKISVA